MDIARGEERDKPAAAKKDANFDVDYHTTTTTNKKFNYDGNNHRRVVQTSSSPFSVDVPTHPRVHLGLWGPAPNNRGGSVGGVELRGSGGKVPLWVKIRASRFVLLLWKIEIILKYFEILGFYSERNFILLVNKPLRWLCFKIIKNTFYT